MKKILIDTNSINGRRSALIEAINLLISIWNLKEIISRKEAFTKVRYKIDAALSIS